MNVIVVEEWNGKVVSNEYPFNSVEDKENFIELCKDNKNDCLIIECVNNNKILKGVV